MRKFIFFLLACSLYGQVTQIPGGGGGGGGSGTVNAGTANQLAFYGSNGTAVSGLLSCASGVYVTSGANVPSCSTTLPAGLTIPGFLTTTLASTNFIVGNGSNVATAVAASGDVTLANTGAFTVTQVEGAAIPISGLLLGTNASKQLIAAALASTNIYVGNGSNLPVGVALSGDGTLANTGAISITNLSHVTNGSLASSGLANTAVTPTSYTNANITVNAQGQITAASSGSGGSGGGINAQTISYTLVTGDNGKLVTMTGLNLTATLPASPPSSAWTAWVINLSSTTTLTVARNSLLINGVGANITLNPYQAAYIWTDGSNYFLTTQPVIGGNGILVGSASNNTTVSLDTTYAPSIAALLQGNNTVAFSTTGSTSYIASPVAGCSTAALTTGMEATLNVDTASATTASVNYCGLGNKTIDLLDGSTAVGTAIAANVNFNIFYDGTVWRLKNSQIPGSLLSLSAHDISGPMICANSTASGTVQVCNTVKSFTPIAGDTIIYETNTSNTGDLTINVNSLGAKHARKWQGSSTLASGDLLLGIYMLATYDGTFWEFYTIGNAPSAGGVSSFTGDAALISNSASTGAVTVTLANAAAGSLWGNNTSSSAAPGYSVAPVLGVDNTTAGTLQLANSAANAHTIFKSGATTTNTIAGFATVPTTGHLVSCTTATTTCTLTDSGVVAANVNVWNSLTAPTGNLSLAMAANTSFFTTTTAEAQMFAWKNTTAAVIGTSQGSPLPALCGTAFHGSASVEECMTFGELPGNGNDATIVQNIGHTGTSTGSVSLLISNSLIASTTLPSRLDVSDTVGVTAIALTGKDLVASAATTTEGILIGLDFNGNGNAAGQRDLFIGDSAATRNTTCGNIDIAVGVNPPYLRGRATNGASNNCGIGLGDPGSSGVTTIYGSSVTIGPKIASYGGVALVDNGVPSAIAHIDLTGQTAAITNSTTLFTPGTTGRFRVTYYAKVTTASAGGTSILGGTVGFQVLYTDGTDSVAQTVTLPQTSQAGNTVTIGTGNTGNTTTTVTYGEGTFYMKTGVAVTYGFGYTTTVGTMAYEIHVTVEAL